MTLPATILATLCTFVALASWALYRLAQDEFRREDQYRDHTDYDGD